MCFSQGGVGEDGVRGESGAPGKFVSYKSV